MAMQNSECAMGMYPLKGNADSDHRSITAQFAPREGFATDALTGNVTAVCHGCDQVTMVKTVAPRKGYFAFHKASVKGHVPQKDMLKGGGTPARERGRRTS